MRPPRTSLACALLAVTATTTACATPAPQEPKETRPIAAPTRTAYPLTFDNCGWNVTIERPPRRVLILNGTSVGEVESFVLLGLQKHILANAQHYGVSEDPKMIPAIDALPRKGLTMNRNFDVPAEQVLAARPDLVVSTWSGGFEPKSGFASREQLTAASVDTLVNPVNCAMGKPSATPAEKRAYEAQSIESSFEFLELLGRVFDVQQKARDLTDRLRVRVDAVRARVAGKQPKKVLIAYPGMAMMNANGLPAVMTGGIYDDVIRAAGGENAFAGDSGDTTRTLNKEQLAAARVDVLVVGIFTPDEDPEKGAAELFAEYPQWNASRTRTFTTLSDGAYLGPMNAWAVEKLAATLHPRS